MRYLIILMFLFATSASSGQNGQIKGQILDVDEQVVVYANVLLRSVVDSSFVKGEVSNQQGNFRLENIQLGKYLLTIRAVGYRDTTFSLNLNQSIDLGTLILNQQNKELDGLSVVAIKPMFTMQADKMVVHIEDSPVSQGNTAWELLARLPGVAVMDGNIVLRGKSGVNILVNDKPLALLGTDLENYLKSIHASQIKNIELITNPSAKYDAQGSSGIINIILAKPSGVGFNGSIASGYGRGTGTHKAYTTLNLSHSGTKGDLIFSISDNFYEAFNNLDIEKNFFSQDTLSGIVRNDNDLTLYNNALSSRLGYDWYISQKTSLSFQATGNYRTGAWDNVSQSKISDGNDQLNSVIDFASRSDDKWYMYSGNAHLNRQMDSTGQKISADLDVAQYSTNSTNWFQSIYQNPNGTVIDTLYETGYQRGPLSIYSAKLDYTKPLKRNWTFEAGVKSSYVLSDKDVAFFYNGDENLLDSTKSNHFIYSENINAAYVNFSKPFKKLSTQFGLRAENTNAVGEQKTYGIDFERSYTQIFPTVFLNYKMSEKHNFSLNAGRRINRPQYQQLNPFIRPIDATAWASGNPDLQPELSYNTELTYSLSNQLFIQGGFSHTNNGIISVLGANPETQETLQKDDNVDIYNEYTLMIMYNSAIKKWWYTNLNFTGFYAQYDGSLLGFYFDRSLPTFYASAQNTFLLKKGLKIEQSYTYMHRHLHGTTLIKAIHGLSLGIKKDILKGKGTLTLNANDVFWTNFPSGETDFNGVLEFWTSRRDSRTVFLHFTYNFGSGKKVRIRRESGADDEKGRAG